MKTFFQSKTIWLALVQAVAGGLVIFFTQMDLVGYAVIAKSVGDIVLRSVTESKILL